MNISINSSRYGPLLSEINALLPTGTRVIMTIYTNQDGSDIVSDSNGVAFENRIFSSISYQYPIDSELGFLTISFDNGTHIKINDDAVNYWYFIQQSSTGIMPLV
jgi:hypothetical protein